MKTLAAFVVLAAGALGLTVSACAAPDFADARCPPGGTELTYESFGQPFLARYCETCHGRDVPDRRGAPDKYTFDSRKEVLAWKDRIYDRSAGDNASMPPGPDDPPIAERDRLAEWLACGAP
jgi:uncharacterized membrane protein